MLRTPIIVGLALLFGAVPVFGQQDGWAFATEVGGGVLGWGAMGVAATFAAAAAYPPSQYSGSGITGPGLAYLAIGFGAAPLGAAASVVLVGSAFGVHGSLLAVATAIGGAYLGQWLMISWFRSSESDFALLGTPLCSALLAAVGFNLFSSGGHPAGP